MAIPNRQIGWSQESNLLWEILKKTNQLGGIVANGGGGGGVQSVTGLNTDNTDPNNPIVQISVDGSTITGSGTPGDPLVASGGGGTNPTTQFIPVNNSGVFDDSYLKQETDVLKTVYSGNDIGVKLDLANKIFSFGDFDGVGDGSYINVSNAQVINMHASDGINIDCNSGMIKTSTGGYDRGLIIDYTNSTYRLGEGPSTGNGTNISVDDNTGIITATGLLYTPNGLQEAVYTGIDLQSADYYIYAPGIYEVVVGTDTFFTNYQLYFPDPTLFPGCKITVINTDASYTAIINNNGYRPKEYGSINAASAIGTEEYHQFVSIGGYWRGGKIGP